MHNPTVCVKEKFKCGVKEEVEVVQKLSVPPLSILLKNFKQTRSQWTLSYTHRR